jgi:hypothetical protein
MDNKLSIKGTLRRTRCARNESEKEEEKEESSKIISTVYLIDVCATQCHDPLAQNTTK